jgi:hypothetical protein
VIKCHGNHEKQELCAGPARQRLLKRKKSFIDAKTNGWSAKDHPGGSVLAVLTINVFA